MAPPAVLPAEILDIAIDAVKVHILCAQKGRLTLQGPPWGTANEMCNV